MNRFFLEFEYNGEKYHGWQIQPNAVSVQETLNDCISKILREKIYVIGAGRTDTGVHAQQMFCHFDTEKNIDDSTIYRLNKILPKDIYIKNFFSVKKNAHTRFDAISRRYEYYISVKKNVFQGNYCYYLNKNLDLNLMNQACKVLLQYNNFKCFSKTKTQVNNYLCNIIKAEWIKKDDLIILNIQADRFLRNMVRAIVGTMIDIGLKKKTITDFKEILNSKDRTKAGYSVPAKGLFLVEIKYPKEIYI